MKAIGYIESLAIEEHNALMDIESPKPTASGRDLLVKIAAIAVNPVDCKVRMRAQPENGQHKILGWDAVGEVVAVGEDVSLFSVGEQVFYAGDLTRQGTNAEYHLVDERIVGKKPVTISNAEAAAIPLTAITAWELLFDRLALQQNKETTKDILLVTGAAGGVGSILVQLAKTLIAATVIGTASRDESKVWLEKLGVDHVIDHTKPLKSQLGALGIDAVTHVASLNATDSYFEQFVDILAPFGKLGLIDDPDTIPINSLKSKSISLHWEFMYTHSMFKTDSMIQQHHLLNQVSALIDQGKIRTTLGQHLGLINAKNLRKAHQMLESGCAIGKLVLEGF
ncbi:zinc-binding alcohol dehydrogenase family protein [Agaribacter marinus]|uniref:Zinc-type alcohol dehydrogenase-like protein n=1 Tax=Agaribacter marinus TaxID=1431249 RepID=A0AA37T5G7_9ALTE|nr:zinc-binding alcohol dehydrogenase family protein [Agaribacter marinus]GLR71845.1 alcohol dehydrogenase [Agaribacter marinus]